MNGDAARKPYTDEQRQEALRPYVQHGPGEASRQCGISSATIRSWAHRAGLSHQVPMSEKTKAATVRTLDGPIWPITVFETAARDLKATVAVLTLCGRRPERAGAQGPVRAVVKDRLASLRGARQLALSATASYMCPERPTERPNAAPRGRHGAPWPPPRLGRAAVCQLPAGPGL